MDASTNSLSTNRLKSLKSQLNSHKRVLVELSWEEQVAIGSITPTGGKLIVQSWQRKTGHTLTMIESFYHAFHGVWIGFQEQRNIRVHLAAAAMVTAAGLWFKVDSFGWISLIFAIGFVLACEFINTALEHMVDLTAGGKYYASARAAKDTAAAAVLIASIVATSVGLIVLGPHLLSLFR